MPKHNLPPKTSLQDGQNEGSSKMIQKKRVFAALFQSPKTMKMVSEELVIDRANICRYIDEFRKLETVQLLKYGICPITKHPRVGFYTTNPQLFIKPTQLNLF